MVAGVYGVSAKSKENKNNQLYGKHSSMENDLKTKLYKEARYLQIVIPYDKDDRMITFDDSVMIELECNDEFTPPMFNSEDKLLEYVIDLEERKVLNWDYEDGYLRMQGKVRDSGTYTLLDADKKPLWQIRGYVPNKLIPPLDRGFGDYIELPVDADESIESWPTTPDFSEFIEEGKEPIPIKTNKWHRAKEALWSVRRMNSTRKRWNG